jgi:hypothetical protein
VRNLTPITLDISTYFISLLVCANLPYLWQTPHLREEKQKRLTYPDSNTPHQQPL